ncbi:Type 1 glutamine amidotransferase-like domain-containing protein [Shewanella sp. KX20019]|uniref:Type 1 glutamine amidotransferase-like domain-containing protein n=1 Tax=Shewanella sp. KX20019 TaxID=2803864 RepID=UPI0019276329|nr:Type 1 glutamine amidotransferase-like domain-containing protein [Shewanella sp. KX20019]QQX78669.1 Type 1 glutamine amidotransferase-like domain-containing protein [Shewanella sp. KX20019]
MLLALLSQPTSSNARLVISELLSRLATATPKIGYIASMPDPQREYYQQSQQLYAELNVEMTVYLELESEFTQQALDTLLTCDVIHLSGGDTQRFLNAIKRRQLIAPLTKFAVNGGAIVGVSAGAMVLTPSIACAVLCGDQIKGSHAELTALNLIPFQFVPHFEIAQLKDANFNQQLKTLKSAAYLCGDDDALLLSAEQLVIFGEPRLVNN